MYNYKHKFNVYLFNMGWQLHSGYNISKGPNQRWVTGGDNLKLYKLETKVFYILHILKCKNLA